MSLSDAARRIDQAAYAEVADMQRPQLDAAMRRLSRAADYSKLWLGGAAVLALGGGPGGRRAARRGLASLAVAATVANAIAKPFSSRRRPERIEPSLASRHVRMPRSSSFPSGHTASAFAFATGAAHEQPALLLPLGGAAAAVGYSRVHTGVHFPGDVLAGAILGVGLAKLTNRVLDRRARLSRRS